MKPTKCLSQRCRLCSQQSSKELREFPLFVQNPTQSLQDLHLQDHEVLDCEPLHDYKGHAYNLLQELPILLSPPLKKTVTEIISTTLTDKVSGALLRVASIKVLLKLLKEKDVDKRVKQLLCTLIKISELLYASV